MNSIHQSKVGGELESVLRRESWQDGTCRPATTNLPKQVRKIFSHPTCAVAEVVVGGWVGAKRRPRTATRALGHSAPATQPP